MLKLELTNNQISYKDVLLLNAIIESGKPDALCLTKKDPMKWLLAENLESLRGTARDKDVRIVFHIGPRHDIQDVDFAWSDETGEHSESWTATPMTEMYVKSLLEPPTPPKNSSRAQRFPGYKSNTRQPQLPEWDSNPDMLFDLLDVVLEQEKKHQREEQQRKEEEQRHKEEEQRRKEEEQQREQEAAQSAKAADKGETEKETKADFWESLRTPEPFTKETFNTQFMKAAESLALTAQKCLKDMDVKYIRLYNSYSLNVKAIELTGAGNLVLNKTSGAKVLFKRCSIGQMVAATEEALEIVEKWKETHK